MTSPPLDGVNVVGYFYEASGLGEIARLVVRSLSAAGIAYDPIPVGARPLRTRLERRQARYGTSIVCINASELPKFVDTLGRRFMQERRTIGFWWWEVDTFPSSGAQAAHLVDEIWVGSEHVRRAVAAATDTTVEVFPVPIVAQPQLHWTRGSSASTQIASPSFSRSTSRAPLSERTRSGRSTRSPRVSARRRRSAGSEGNEWRPVAASACRGRACRRRSSRHCGRGPTATACGLQRTRRSV